MKRFNLDELIWLIILVLLTSLIIFLITSGNIKNFAGENMLIYFYISIGILAIFSIAQFNKIFTIRSRNEITIKFIPLVFLIVISTIFLYILPAYRALVSKNIDDKLLYTNPEAIIINNDNHTMLDDIEANYNKYEDKVIELIGYVYEASDFTDEIILAREEVSCCQQDKRTYKVRVKGIGQNIDSRQWIKVAGRVKNDGTWYLELVDYRLTKQPEQLYFYEAS